MKKKSKRNFKGLVQDILHFIGYDIQYYYPNYSDCPRGFIQFLRKYYRGRKNLIGAEIGVHKGENAVNILKYLPIKKLYLIDPYKDYPNYTESEDSSTNQKGLDDARVQASQKLSEFENKIVWINEFSDMAHKKIQEKLDFVYIDGNHSYEFVRMDMKNYYPLLKEKGILAGHDIEPSVHTGVLFAFTDFIKEKNLLCHIITPDWIIVKGGKLIY
ncbi:class I SAM-dependent methyltransferase [Patescibacteria group bacterium]|nr:class I SAM-dependent methyltransferase [Patescibacteria group bacterium]MBU4078508.1 class I SAM-dependent methyltransferase [Patescibacteria group bacterium]